MFNSYRIKVYLSLIIGSILSLSIYFFIHNSEQNKIQIQFNYKSNNIEKAFQTNIERTFDTINIIASFFSNVKEPNREEFRNLVNTAIKRNSIITGVSWNPLVKNIDREKYIENARKDGLLDFEFTGLNNGKREISLTKPDYVPVYYIEPQLKNKKALGFDISSNNERREAIYKARDSGQIVLSDRIKLVQGSFGALAMKAVYAKGERHNTIEERRKNFKGVVVGVISFKEINDKVVKSLNINEINIKLLDFSASLDKQLLHEHIVSINLPNNTHKWEKI